MTQLGSHALYLKIGGNKWTPRKPTSVHTQSVHAPQRQANIAARSAKRWKRHQISTAGANTPYAKGTRTRNFGITFADSVSTSLKEKNEKNQIVRGHAR